MPRTRLIAGILAFASPAAFAQEVTGWRSQTLSIDDTPVKAERATLTVPENRDREGARTINLAFARLRSTAKEPGPPLFFIPGGPGDPAISRVRSSVWLPFLEVGDVVFLDPRGVGESEPDLQYESKNIDPIKFFADRATAVQHMSEICGEAAAAFAKRGIDLSRYQTREMADDLETLRVALGYDSVHALGHSFGTILGQVWIRRHPGAVARFIAVGSAGTYDMMKRPSQLDRSLQRLAEVVAADPTVGEDMPDLFADVEDAVAVVDDEPLVVEVNHNGERQEAAIGAFGLRLILLIDLGDTADLPVIPRLVRSVQERDPTLLRWFVEKRLAAFSRLPAFMLYCRAAAGATEQRWTLIREEAETSPFGLARCLFSPEADHALGVVDLGDEFREPVQSDVPVLFVSGTLDAATPPEQAEQVRQGFAHSGHVVVEYGGHEDLMIEPAVQRAAVQFLRGAEPKDVTISRPPLPFAPLYGPSLLVQHPALKEG